MVQMAVFCTVMSVLCASAAGRVHLPPNPQYNILQREPNDQWDLYRALDVKRLASEPEIRRAFRFFARKHHPGRCHRSRCDEEALHRFYRRQQGTTPANAAQSEPIARYAVETVRRPMGCAAAPENAALTLDTH
jgi:hypothetical protein